MTVTGTDGKPVNDAQVQMHTAHAGDASNGHGRNAVIEDLTWNGSEYVGNGTVAWRVLDLT